MRILALVPGGIGDQILFFPTLETLKGKYPNAVIDVLVEPRAKAAYRICKNVNDVLIFDYRDRSSLADYLNLLGVIRDREYEIALTTGTPWFVELLIWLNGIPVRVGYKNNNSWLLSSSVPFKSEQYKADTYHELLTGLGINLPCPPITINVPKDDINWAEIETKRLDIKDSGYILLYSSSELYPVASWQKIITDIRSKQPELPIVLLQDANNGEWITAIQQTDLSLKTIAPADLGKLAATIAGANLLLCTVSIPMYLSVATGTYTITLSGSTEEKKLLPPNSESYLSIQSSTGKLADLKPEQVLEQIWRS
jgi:ADP-heptose:LPS heptosyltransferase